MRAVANACWIIAVGLGGLGVHAACGADKSSGDPAADSYAPLPIVHYAAISIARRTASDYAEWLSADDSLHVAFCWSNDCPKDPYTGGVQSYPMLQWKNGKLSSLANVKAIEYEVNPDGTRQSLPININGITNQGVAYGSTKMTPYDPYGGPDDHYPPPEGIPYQLNCFPWSPTFTPDKWNHLGWEDDNTHSGIIADIYLANNTGGYAGWARNLHNYAYSDGYAYWVGGTSRDAWHKGTPSSGDQRFAMFNYAFHMPKWAFFQRLKPPGPPLPAPGLSDLYFRVGALSDSGLALGNVFSMDSSCDSVPPEVAVGLGLWDGLQFRTYRSLQDCSVTNIDNEGHALLTLAPCFDSEIEFPPALLETQTTSETPQPLDYLLAPAFQNEVKIAEAPIISNERTGDHSYRILCYVDSLDPIKHPDGGVGILTNQPDLDPDTHQPTKDHWSYARIVLPDNVDVDQIVNMNPDGVLTASGCADTTKPQSQQTSDVMLLVPVELKATSASLPGGPTGLNYGPYFDTPRWGSLDNLLSVWPSTWLSLTVTMPEPFQSNPPNGFITWTCDGFTIPDRTTQYKFSWPYTGTKMVNINVGNVSFQVKVEVPDVGTLSQEEALNSLDPFAAVGILLWGNTAEEYATRTYPNTAIRDAMRHAYWNALGASDLDIGPGAALLVTTAHEWNNKNGFNNGGLIAAPQPSFDSSMDLHNDVVGATTIHTLRAVPDTVVILQDLVTRYNAGLMYIWDGGLDESHSQGFLLRSNGSKIYH